MTERCAGFQSERDARSPGGASSRLLFSSACRRMEARASDSLALFLPEHYSLTKFREFLCMRVSERNTVTIITKKLRRQDHAPPGRSWHIAQQTADRSSC